MPRQFYICLSCFSSHFFLLCTSVCYSSSKIRHRRTSPIAVQEVRLCCGKSTLLAASIIVWLHNLTVISGLLCGCKFA
ncbi:hypothetical protein Ancab_033702 [Ancistrocladus abbreviatus]